MKVFSSNNKINVIAVVGPTASGKTSYSINLAKQIDGEIISADSRLVYKGFNIGTAKPTIEETQGIPHYMIDIVEPETDYSAGLYVQEAKEIIKNIHKRNKTPIIVGGTGLYIDMLLKGYDLPKIEADKQLREELKNKTSEELYEILAKKDKTSIEKIDKNDKKKIIRAIELITISGKSLKDIRGFSHSDYNVKWVGKNFPRAELYKRIDDRVDIMIEKGLIDETKELLQKHGPIPNLINTIGYKEIFEYLNGTYTLEEAIALLKRNTRRYAKRQLTWFRRNEQIEWDVFPEILKR